MKIDYLHALLYENLKNLKADHGCKGDVVCATCQDVRAAMFVAERQMEESTVTQTSTICRPVAVQDGTLRIQKDF